MPSIMDKNTSYWEVQFRNTESEERWCVVKAPASMNEYQIRSNMMDDSDVAEVFGMRQVFGAHEIEDFSRDFTY